MDEYTQPNSGPALPQRTVAPRPSKYTQENIAPGVELKNYTSRTPSEDNTYVLVTNHSEWIEKIKQPEEIAAEKRAAKIAMGVLGTLGVGFLGLIGWVAYKDEQDYRRTVGHPNVTPLPAKPKKDDSKNT